ncbi:unnamed protein product [Umbelopsis vinacea]
MRANKISLGLELLNYRNNEYMKQFSMSIKSEMAIVNARIVPIPTFITASPLVMAPVFLKGMLGNLRGKRVAQAATLASWFVVFFCHPQQVPMHDIQSLPITHADAQGNIDRTLKETWVKPGNAARLLPNSLSASCPIPVFRFMLKLRVSLIQPLVLAPNVSKSKHIHEAKKQYCASVCLKVNLKLGAMISFIVPQQIPFISQRHTILFGADVTHPAPGGMNRPSITALCRSMDDRASR